MSASARYVKRIIARRSYRDLLRNDLVVMRSRAPPRYFVLELIFTEHLITHYLDIMAGMPITMTIEAPGVFEHTGKLYTSRPPEIRDRLASRHVCLRQLRFFFCLPLEYFVISIRIERRVDVDQVNAFVLQVA